jgi:redox-regulated HSP33 family molecular chaperone
MKTCSKPEARKRVESFESHPNDDNLTLLLSGAATLPAIVKVFETDDNIKGVVRLPVRPIRSTAAATEFEVAILKYIFLQNIYYNFGK